MKLVIFLIVLNVFFIGMIHIGPQQKRETASKVPEIKTQEIFLTKLMRK